MQTRRPVRNGLVSVSKNRSVFLLGVAVAFEKQLCKIAPKFAWGILPKVYLSQPVLIKL